MNASPVLVAERLVCGYGERAVCGSMGLCVAARQAEVDNGSGKTTLLQTPRVCAARSPTARWTATAISWPIRYWPSTMRSTCRHVAGNRSQSDEPARRRYAPALHAGHAAGTPMIAEWARLTLWLALSMTLVQGVLLLYGFVRRVPAAMTVATPSAIAQSASHVAGPNYQAEVGRFRVVPLGGKDVMLRRR